MVLPIKKNRNKLINNRNNKNKKKKKKKKKKFLKK